MDFGNPNVAFNPLPWLSLPFGPSSGPSASVDADLYARTFLGGGIDPTSTTASMPSVAGTISPDALFGSLPQEMSSSSSSTGSEPYSFGDDFARQRDSIASSTSSFLFPPTANLSDSSRPSTPERVVLVKPPMAKRLRSSAAVANAAIVATAREEEDETVKEKSPGGKKKRRPRKMTEKRREQNRLAQKNLRARRAAQYSEYHDRVDVLEKENQELRTLIEALRDENSALRTSPSAAGSISVPQAAVHAALLGHIHRGLDTDFTGTSGSEVDFESDFEHPGSPF